ncbi:thioredoxin family protein [Pseudomonas sp. DWP3-1-2]|uniref:thioredoxin family protein n=1 Tax=Pseudomonas sp. DWP3-1-2 TaxID=2804645 RepID=UPI003CF96B53
MDQLELSDFDIDQQLLQLAGTSLVIFTGAGCASCRFARQQLPRLDLPVQRLCWVDAEENGGAVERYEVFHLPALFIVRDGRFFGGLRAPLKDSDIRDALTLGLTREPDELP